MGDLRSLLFLCVVLLAQPATAQQAPPAHSKGPLEGVWRVTELNRAGQPSIQNPQPGLMIFTPSYFSWIIINAGEPRPTKDAVTDAEKLAMWGPITAQSGTYRVDGGILFLRPMVTRDQHHMSEPDEEFAWTVKGDSLTITAKKPGGWIGGLKILRRVE